MRGVVNASSAAARSIRKILEAVAAGARRPRNRIGISARFVCGGDVFYVDPIVGEGRRRPRALSAFVRRRHKGPLSFAWLRDTRAAKAAPPGASSKSTAEQSPRAGALCRLSLGKGTVDEIDGDVAAGSSFGDGPGAVWGAVVEVDGGRVAVVELCRLSAKVPPERRNVKSLPATPTAMARPSAPVARWPPNSATEPPPSEPGSMTNSRLDPVPDSSLLVMMSGQVR
jgi:hypothetical protein